MRPTGSPSELEHRRKLAVRRILEGFDLVEVADLLEVDPSSVRKWMGEFRDGGWHALDAHVVAGRPPKLTLTQEKIVFRWLRESPVDFGFSSDLWTAERIAGLIDEEFGVRFNSDYLGTWLRSHGHTPQVPVPIPRERNAQKILYWLRVSWPRIQKKAKKLGADIAFVDESGVLMAPLRRRSWAQRGHPPSIHQKGSGQRGKISIAASIWINLESKILGLYHQTLENSYFTNFESTCFIEAFALAHRRPLIIVWDGGSMHKGDCLRSLKRTSPIKVYFERLPPYAPMLNPVEYLWNWLKYDRLCNFAALDVTQLSKRTIRELDSIEHNQALLMAFLRGSNLPLPRALLT